MLRFLRKVKTVAKKRKLAYRWSPERRVGSHGTVYLGGRFAIVKDLKKELRPGLLADMCKQLGIRKLAFERRTSDVHCELPRELPDGGQ